MHVGLLLKADLEQIIMLKIVMYFLTFKSIFYPDLIVDANTRYMYLVNIYVGLKMTVI